MLDDLIRRGPNAYDKFLYCLDNSGHEHLANFIRDAEKKIRNPNETVMYERRDSPAHHPTDSRNDGDRHLHPSASAVSNQSYNSPNISSSGGVVTSPSDESASNHGNTNLSEQDNNTTDDVRMENDTDQSNMSSQGNWICMGTL